MDVSGEVLTDTHWNIHRTRLDLEGNAIYGSVDDLQFMSVTDIKEGCRITGNIIANKVAGNFHILLGSSLHATSRHIHQFMIKDLLLFNASHTIHQLRFGDWFPNIKNPLEGVTQTVTEGTGHFQYFLKVVPTIYQYASGSHIDTNQYSVTNQTHHITQLPTNGMIEMNKIPGVVFIYEISPFMVQIMESRTTWLRFITSLCAMIGGVWTIMSIIDACWHHIKKQSK